MIEDVEDREEDGDTDVDRVHGVVGRTRAMCIDACNSKNFRRMDFMNENLSRVNNATVYRNPY